MPPSIFLRLWIPSNNREKSRFFPNEKKGGEPIFTPSKSELIFDASLSGRRRVSTSLIVTLRVSRDASLLHQHVLLPTILLWLRECCPFLPDAFSLLLDPSMMRQQNLHPTFFLLFVQLHFPLPLSISFTDLKEGRALKMFPD